MQNCIKTMKDARNIYESKQKKNTVKQDWAAKKNPRYLKSLGYQFQFHVSILYGIQDKKAWLYKSIIQIYKVTGYEIHV